MPEFFTIFARKWPNFTWKLPEEYFPDFFFWGGGMHTLPSPVSYAYESNGTIDMPPVTMSSYYGLNISAMTSHLWYLEFDAASAAAAAMAAMLAGSLALWSREHTLFAVC